MLQDAFWFTDLMSPLNNCHLLSTYNEITQQFSCIRSTQKQNHSMCDDWSKRTLHQALQKLSGQADRRVLLCL
uniref:Uncharacterized protein n=1 Tax=Oryza brachyantha TaxID=4533 RepID=J3LNA8_ORYBR